MTGDPPPNLPWNDATGFMLPSQDDKSRPFRRNWQQAPQCEPSEKICARDILMAEIGSLDAEIALLRDDLDVARDEDRRWQHVHLCQQAWEGKIHKLERELAWANKAILDIAAILNFFGARDGARIHAWRQSPGVVAAFTKTAEEP